jgi:hypothetical protein
MRCDHDAQICVVNLRELRLGKISFHFGNEDDDDVGRFIKIKVDFWGNL